MGIIADENVPKSVILALRKAGVPVRWVVELGLRGLRNSVLAERAISAGSAILTCDSDFLNIAGSRVMVVYLEQTGNPEEMKNIALQYVKQIIDLLNRGHGAILLTRRGIEVR
ncbi:MAG: DUF5615 family PIN-like protein [Nitrososphaerales archaeon]